MALVFNTQSPAYYEEFRKHMAQIKLNTIQIVLMAYYKNLLIQIILMAHFSENDMIQLKDMFPIVATWLQFSTEEYIIYQVEWPCFKHYNFGLLSSPQKYYLAKFMMSSAKISMDEYRTWSKS